MISTFCFLAAMTDPFDEAGKANAHNELFASKQYRNYGRKALERNRTVDLILTMDMLCQLSYKGILRSVGTLSLDTSFVNYAGFRSSVRHENCYLEARLRKAFRMLESISSRLKARRAMPMPPKARAVSAKEAQAARLGFQPEKSSE